MLQTMYPRNLENHKQDKYFIYKNRNKTKKQTTKTQTNKTNQAYTIQNPYN